MYVDPLYSQKHSYGESVYFNFPMDESWLAQIASFTMAGSYLWARRFRFMRGV